MSLRDFWDEALTHLKNEIDTGEYEFWFSGVEFSSSSDDKIILSVPSSFFRDQLIKKFVPILAQSLHDLSGRTISFDFEIVKKEISSAPKEEAPVHSPVKKKKSHPSLTLEYTFENFVIAGENALAYNAAMAIAMTPGTNYNPFLIYGGVGLGKTHLMQAIGNSLYSEKPNLNIAYIPAENFVNEFYMSVQNKAMPQFKNKYRNVDVLLIDDIHDLQNKKETQEELFNTFNALFDARKQMVFTCDRAPMELKNLTDRLLNRLSRGLVVDLHMPSWETRLVILRKKVENLKKNIHIPESVLELIAKNVTTNVRDLEAALMKICAYTELVNKELTVEVAQAQLKNIFAGPAQQNIPMDLVMRVVSEYYNLSLQDMKGKKKTQAISGPRQTAMYLIREMTEFSTTEVGLEFGGRDHTTVMHAVQKIEDRLKTEPNFEVTLQNLKRTIKERATKTL